MAIFKSGLPLKSHKMCGLCVGLRLKAIHIDFHLALTKLPASLLGLVNGIMGNTDMFALGQ